MKEDAICVREFFTYLKTKLFKYRVVFWGILTILGNFESSRIKFSVFKGFLHF